LGRRRSALCHCEISCVSFAFFLDVMELRGQKMVSREGCVSDAALRQVDAQGFDRCVTCGN
jgi:hypothetical protein